MSELWDINRVAEYLGVTQRTVYNKVRSGVLPATKVGRLWRVRETDLEAWLLQSRPIASGGMPAREPGGVPSREDLDARVSAFSDTLERRLAFVAVLTRGVEALGWPAPVIVGGHAVEFWTAGDYPTVDIDLAGASEPVADVLGRWGFMREGRHWYDERLGLVLEVPASGLEAAQRDRAVSVDIGGLWAHILGIEDLIVDRLNACVHWHDEESCLWAVALIRTARELDEPYLRERAITEDVSDKLAWALEEAARS
ncbi:MAG: helix-turn-helix domain-containing protein [Coriobacteriia bacterium]